MLSKLFLFTLLQSCILLTGSMAFAAEEPSPLPLDSKITGVTVYADRAEVTRTATVKLPEGRHLLVFSAIPEAIDAGSIQVNGPGNALLQDIRLERKQQLENTDEKAQKLEERLQEFNDSQAVIESATSRAESERAFVQKIVDAVTVSTGKEVPLVLDPEKWIKMVAFYRERLNALDEQIRQNNRSAKEVTRQAGLVNRMLEDLQSGNSKSDYQVQVTVDVKKEGSMIFSLTYIVFGPRWTPRYDIRMSSVDKKMKIVYKAQILQNTTEDWKNVTIRLSTAQPQSGGQHPNLTPWNISFSSPRTYYDNESNYRLKQQEAPSPVQMMNSMPEKVAKESKDDVDAPMAVATVAVETRATSVVFVAEGKTTVNSDNQPYTVTVAEASYPAVLRYSVVPKLAQHAYLKAKVTNTATYPLLPGETTIYFDNAFVAKGTMQLVAPTESFWTFLGVDAAIGVKHQLVKRYEKQEGVVGKKTCIVYEYLVTLTNNKKTEEELVMWDQLPVSGDQNLVVELIEPKFKANTETLKLNENNYLEWLFRLKPGQEIKVPFSFSVTYPKNRMVYGLQ